MMPRLPPGAWRRRLAVSVLLGGSACVLWLMAGRALPAPAAPTHLALLVPDGLSDDDVQVHAWRDAAAEVGFPLDVVSASQLLRSGGTQRDAALILPDTMHRQMNDALVAHLQQRVQDGARLMLVHDAGVADMDGQYHLHQSRLSALAGVRYALYSELNTGMLREQVAWLDASALPLLRLPPGKLMREDSDNPLTSAQPAPRSSEELAVVSYHYGRLRYPVFATRGAFDGRRLMHGDGDGLLAGVHRVGRGEVLFVNLPLTYLKLRTDGFFLHSFLRYFAQDIAHLPQLSAMPDGRGALVMNWHIDSATAVPAMEQLAALGVFEQGPYSVHLTAGPDVNVPGDGGGMNLDRNPVMQAWVRRFTERGDEVGSHGGWIHNEFGRLIGTQPPERSGELIERNSAAVSRASGRPVREYSAPTGNHPAWVTPWLRERGINAYYFTGDIGMAPTRSYQEGRRGPADMWAFPVLSYGSYAAFEEAHAHQVPQDHVAAWLNDVADFCATHRTVRLVYFHPSGVAIFPQAFKRWLLHTGALVRDGSLRWTTMAQYADFANQRLKTRWQVRADEADPGRLRLEASHPTSLAQMTWLLPAQRYAQPQVLEGQAQVLRDGPYWRVVAGGGTGLTMGVALLPEPGPALGPAPVLVPVLVPVPVPVPTTAPTTVAPAVLPPPPSTRSL